MVSRRSEPARIVFLTQDSMAGYVCDDDLALPACKAHGLEVDTISWRAEANWADYAAVIVRSTWDYQRHLEDFLRVLADIDTQTTLANSLSLMRWNVDKRYLAELEQRGVDIVPTVFGENLSPEQFAQLRAAADREHVIKPVVSAGAERTYRVGLDIGDDMVATVLDGHADSGWMWQPFLPQIVEEGEFSLFYFSGVLSHVILKTPVPGDFRVQEEFGGHIRAVEAEPELIRVADSVMAALDETPLYSRVDLVRATDGQGFWLIEIELIEPALYFRTDPPSTERFAQTVAVWLNNQNGR